MKTTQEQNHFKTDLGWLKIKSCFKHYLLNHVKTRFAEIPAPEWEIATFLPTAQWEKSTAGRIYSDSRKIANG